MATSLVGVYDQVTFALRTQMRALTILQEQAATGSRVNRTSDDPLAARDILALNSQVRSLGNCSLAIDGLVASLELCSTALSADEGSVNSSLTEAQRLMTQAIGGTLTPEQQKITAGEINEILEQVVSMANSQNMGNYIFGGAGTETPPYIAERSSGTITAVNYEGSMNTRNVDVAPGVRASGVMVGKTTFGGTGPAEAVFPGDGTGVSAGTGASTATGVIWLNVVLDGSDYKLSIDGGLSYVTADGSANQAVTDSRTGQVLYVNTSNITKEGTDLVQMSGTLDVFSTLISMRDALLSGDPDKITQLQARSAGIFDETQQYIVSSSTWTGAKINSLTSLKEGLQRISDNAEDRTAQLQDVDIAQVAIDLSRYQLLYEMSMNVAARALSTSLMDFLQ
jgi:flagellar hook-associated protein 3 FlgL